MKLSIRSAQSVDQTAMIDLLMQDAEQRRRSNDVLWAISPDARDKIALALKSSLEAENPPFRQQWLVAKAGGNIVGVTHSILLPVPPIYAGDFGAPGLIMEDCIVASDAPAETTSALLAAAEADLREAGARILLGSSIIGGAWGKEYGASGYEPLTVYLSKCGLGKTDGKAAIRKATEKDVGAIVSLSADNRQILWDFDAFWKPHIEADGRFENWMKRSLTLTDRDMFVADGPDSLNGYAISQPATPLHFPAAHEISATGVIDDFYHVGFRDPDVSTPDQSALDLLASAETALAMRAADACLVVCPAAWSSKIALLKTAGYQPAITWYIKR